MTDYSQNREKDYLEFIDQYQKLPNKYECRYLIYKKYGICIDIFAAYTTMSSYKDKDSCTEICPGLWAVYPNHLYRTLVFGVSEREKNFLWEGLKKVCELINHNSPYQLDTLIVIYLISSHECHYQEEGLTPAIIKWAANAFGFEEPQINASFNEKLNKIEFLYD